MTLWMKVAVGTLLAIAILAVMLTTFTFSIPAEQGGSSPTISKPDQGETTEPFSIPAEQDGSSPTIAKRDPGETTEGGCVGLEQYEPDSGLCHCPTRHPSCGSFSGVLQESCECCSFSFSYAQILGKRTLSGAMMGSGEERTSRRVSVVSGDGTRIASYFERGSSGGYIRVYELVEGRTTTLNQIGVHFEVPLTIVSIALSSDGARLVIGYQIATKIFDLVGSSWKENGSFPSTGEYWSSIPTAVSISADGGVIAIASTGGSSGGLVRTFEYDGTKWNSRGEISDPYGFPLCESMKLSGNGQRFVVGGDLRVKGGEVQVYEYDAQNSTWVQIGKGIKGKEFNARVGLSVAISFDGSRIVTGLSCDCPLFCERASSRGTAQVFQYQKGSWVQIGGDLGEWSTSRKLGSNVGISASGDRVFVCEMTTSDKDDYASMVQNGMAYFSVYQLDKGIWLPIFDPIEAKASLSFDRDAIKVSYLDVTTSGSRMITAIPKTGLDSRFRYHVDVYDLTDGPCVSTGGSAGSKTPVSGRETRMGQFERGVSMTETFLKRETDWWLGGSFQNIKGERYPISPSKTPPKRLSPL